MRGGGRLSISMRGPVVILKLVDGNCNLSEISKQSQKIIPSYCLAHEQVPSRYLVGGACKAADIRQ